MPDEETYGSQFLKYLKLVSNRTYFNYETLQQIKKLSQEELAERFKSDSRQFSEIVLHNTPKDAAVLIHLRKTEAASESAGIYRSTWGQIAQ